MAGAEFLKQGVEEFKKLPTGGKIAVGALFVTVAGIGLYEYTKSKGQNSATLPGTDTTGTASSQYPTVPGGSSGQVPVLPGNINPVFDAAGNLVAFGPGSTPAATTPTSTPDAIAAFQQRFGSSPEIRRSGSNWYYVENGKNTLLSSFFPSGTTFSGSSTGTAYATLPGGTKQVISTTHYGTSTPTGKSGGPPIPGYKSQRYHVDERGHMRTVRHINQEIQEDERQQYTIKTHPRIESPEIK